MKVQSAVVVLVNTVFLNVQANMVAGPPNKHGHTCYPIRNYLQLILNQYQEECQEPAHTATSKKRIGLETRLTLMA